MQKSKKILISIFLMTVIVRIILAFLVHNFSYDSYYHLRQVENIVNTGLPLYSDPLSYGGREVLFLPFFHYFMAFFGLFLPLMVVAKIVPNILVASITIISYLIAKKITKNETASLLSALITGFLPILFFTNSFVVETLSLPLIFLTIYSFLNINKKKFLYLYLFSFLLLSLSTFSVFILIIGFGIYLLLSLIENKKIPKSEIEAIIFSLFFFVWTQFLFFKNALIQDGVDFIWKNIPLAIISQYFPKFSLPEALLLVSVIPFITGAIVVYKSLFQLKNQREFLLISFVIATTIFTWLRLIIFKQSLAFFGIILAILFASFYDSLEKYFRKTKLTRYWRYVLPIIIILLLISTVVPAISTAMHQDVPTIEEVSAFKWLDRHTTKNVGVLAILKEGHLVTYYGKRKNLIDDQFRFVEDVEKRFKDVNTMFTTNFQTEALGLADQYGLRYVVFTPSAKEKYDISKLNYATRDCFVPVYKNETRIYLIRCELKQTTEN